MCQARSKGILKLLVLLAVLWPAGAGAQLSGSVVPPSGEKIMIEVDQGKLIRLDQAVASVFIVNPNVADVTVRSSRLIYLFGRKTGKTSLYALDANNNIIVNAEVAVQHNVSSLEEALDILLPSNDLHISSIQGGIILDGSVATAREAEDARRLAARFIGKGEEVINRLAVTGPNQVNLRVRVAEASRNVLNRFGFNWDNLFTIGSFTGDFFTDFPPDEATSFFIGTYTGGSINFSGLIDALADDGLITILSEPNLTALSGETASFLAGGEFPVPIAQDEGTITVEFKQFGVSLSFTPTIISDNRINMRVRPEVSQLSTAGSVSIADFEIPSLSTRRAETTIELASGQSFAIAGLLQDNSQESLQRTPGLGDLPILGALFKSERFQRQETELIIVVTPYIVKPVSGRVPLPTDPYTKEKPAGIAPRTTASRTIPIPTSGSSAGTQTSAAGYILD